MNSEVINPMSVIPPPPAEGGSLVAASAIQPQNPVLPAFELPKEGMRADDQEKKKGQPKAEDLQQMEDASKAERGFLLNEMTVRPVFADLFHRLYDGAVAQIDAMRRQAYQQADINKGGVMSAISAQNPEKAWDRLHAYERTIFYHKTVPGTRFKGAM